MLGPAPEFLIQQVWNLHLGQVHSHAAAATLGPPFENRCVRERSWRQGDQWGRDGHQMRGDEGTA